MASTSSRRAWPAQAPGELSQSQLEVGMASMEQAPEEWSSMHGEHGASPRGMEQHAWRAWSKLQEGNKLQAVAVRCKQEKEKRNTYTSPWRYHRGMARQCPRGHDGIEPEEDADDTSTQQQAQQDQAPPWTWPSNSRPSSRSPWRETRTSEAKGM
jgi:hypothetical protein